MGHSGARGRRVGAGLLVALGALLGAPRKAVAADSPLKAALSDYSSGLKDYGLKKAKAFLATDPTDIEVARALSAAGAALPKKVIAYRGEHEEVMLELQARAGIVTRAHACLDAAHKWLAAHQAPTGEWHPVEFGRWCDGVEQDEPPGGGLGKEQYDVGVTALAVLAFLRAGYTPTEKHPYADVLTKGLKWIVSREDEEGSIGNRASGHWLYGSAAAVTALVEAHRVSGSAEWVEPAQRGLSFLVAAQNPGAGWRYGVRPGESDSSLTGWVALAFEAAKKANDADSKAGKAPTFPFPPEVSDGIRKWFISMTDTKTGIGGYVTKGTGPARPIEQVDAFPAEFSEAMTAAGLCVRFFLGEDLAKNETMAKQVVRLTGCVPAWASNPKAVDLYYWRYASHALSQVRGAPWRTWRKALVDAVASKQRRDGTPCTVRGSWDAADAWGPDGGRVYSTAMSALSLAIVAPFDSTSRPPPPEKGK